MSLTKIQPQGLIPGPSEWQQMDGMAKALFASGFLPEAIKNPVQAVAIIQKGRELQIPPMYALNNIAVIKGKPTCTAELMRALIFRDHGDDALVFTETTNDACEISYKRRGQRQRGTYRFTWNEAIKAGLTNGPNRDTWNKYPTAMLIARCTSAMARLAFADSIGGMYTPEELGAEVNIEEGEVVMSTARVVPAGLPNPDALHEVTTFTQDASGDVVKTDEQEITPTTFRALRAEMSKAMKRHEEGDTKTGWSEEDIRGFMQTKYPDAYDPDDADKRPSTKFLYEHEARELIGVLQVNRPGRARDEYDENGDPLADLPDPGTMTLDEVLG